jgi:hypothetical protein
MFYKIKEQCDNDVVGHYYPQISWSSYMEWYNHAGKHSIRVLWEKYENFATEFPNFTPDLSGIKLVRGAKLTDFLVVGNPIVLL